MSFVKDSFSVFLTRVLLLLLGVGSGVIIARVLGPTNKGILSVAILLPNLLISVGHLGIGNANVYFLGRKKFSFQSILSNSLTLSLIIGGGLILSGLIAFAFLRDTLFKEADLLLIVIAVSTIPFDLFARYASYIFLGKQMIKERNLVNIYHRSSAFICIAAFVLLMRLGVKGALISTVGGLLFAVLYSLHRLSRMGHLSIHFNYQLFKESIKYGIRSCLALIVISLNYRFAILLVKHFLTSADVGYYSLAVSTSNMLNHLPLSTGIITYARVASLDVEQANRLSPKVCRNTILACLVVGVAFFWAGRFLIPLVYGQAYIPAVNAFMILVPGKLMMSVTSVLHSDLTGRGRPEITFYVFSGGLVMNIALSLFLIPRMGIEGATLALTISYTVSSVILACIFSKLTNVRLRELILIQRSDIEDYRRIIGKLRHRGFKSNYERDSER